MQDPKRKKSKREQVKETLTPQRLSVASWAVAAILFGSVGFASVQFSNGPITFDERYMVSGIPLPDAGPIQSTASVGERYGVEVLPASAAGNSTELASHLETLQLQVVAMRRRLETLSEQNRVYSTRIAALEADLRTNSGIAVAQRQPFDQTMTVKDAVDIEAVPAPAMKQTAKAKVAPKQIPHPQAEKIDAPFVLDETPVRLVKLPSASNAPIITGSINPHDAKAKPDNKPRIILPSQPVGRLSGNGASALKSSTFGAVIGTYKTREDAMVAWTRFQEQNEERMRDLEPLLAEEGGNNPAVNLLVGPFGNAADAAVACLRLLEVNDKCHPALYSGMALTASTAKAR